MKSKAPLALMEQMVMLLVFALAAALCLQAFVKSDDISEQSRDKDRAVELAQSVAEIVKSCGGDLDAAAEKLGVTADSDGMAFMIDYTEDWELADGTMRYTLGVYKDEDSGVPGLGTGGVWVRDEKYWGDTAELFRMEIAWQEVLENGC